MPLINNTLSLLNVAIIMHKIIIKFSVQKYIHIFIYNKINQIYKSDKIIQHDIHLHAYNNKYRTQWLAVKGTSGLG